MKRIMILIFGCFLLNSCVVSTAGKIVKTTVKAGVGVVKGTVKGVSWAVSKANGKIDEDRLDGNWKIVGVYSHSYDEIQNTEDPENLFSSQCENGQEILSFKTKKSKLQQVHCSSDKESWKKYKFDFGKNPKTKEKENYLKMPNGDYISIINVSGNNLILEGNLMPAYAFKGAKVYLLEKTK